MHRKRKGLKMTALKLYNILQELILKMPEIEWDKNPMIRGTIAYLAEKIYNANDCSEFLELLTGLAKTKDYNEFCWRVFRKVKLKMYEDPAVNIDRYDSIVFLSEVLFACYKNGDFKEIGIINQQYIPEWFFIIDKCRE